MRYLFNNWNRLKRKLSGKHIFLFLDYDGTLTPIVETPEKAILSKEVRRLLKRLSEVKDLKMAIISGRAIKDIKKIVGLKGMIYAGNHGLEIEGPRIKFENPVSQRYRIVLEKIRRSLNRKLAVIKGAFVEDKGLTLSVHYRLVDESDELALKNIFYGVLRPFLSKGAMHITYGKKVFELRPPIKWDKGKAVLWLLARERFVRKYGSILPIYIGDDMTDESAFKVLKDKGLTIFAGNSAFSSAGYYLNDTDEVIEFLKLILAVQKDKEECRSK